MEVQDDMKQNSRKAQFLIVPILFQEGGCRVLWVSFWNKTWLRKPPKKLNSEKNHRHTIRSKNQSEQAMRCLLAVTKIDKSMMSKRLKTLVTLICSHVLSFHFQVMFLFTNTPEDWSQRLNLPWRQSQKPNWNPSMEKANWKHPPTVFLNCYQQESASPHRFKEFITRTDLEVCALLLLSFTLTSTGQLARVFPHS